MFIYAESQIVTTLEGASNAYMMKLEVAHTVTYIPLSQYRQQKQKITLETLHFIFTHLAKAMVFAHDNNVILGTYEERHIAIELNEKVCIFVSVSTKLEIVNILHKI